MVGPALPSKPSTTAQEPSLLRPGKHACCVPLMGRLGTQAYQKEFQNASH